MGKITGQVLDGSNGQPLASANVYLIDHLGRNIGIGTITNVNGEFELIHDLLDKQGQPFAISYMGYDREEYTRRTLPDPVFLYPKALQLNEIVVRPKDDTPTYMPTDSQKPKWVKPALIASATLLLGFGAYAIAKKD